MGAVESRVWVEKEASLTLWVVRVREYEESQAKLAALSDEEGRGQLAQNASDGLLVNLVHCITAISPTDLSNERELSDRPLPGPPRPSLAHATHPHTALRRSKLARLL